MADLELLSIGLIDDMYEKAETVNCEKRMELVEYRIWAVSIPNNTLRVIFSKEGK